MDPQHVVEAITTEIIKYFRLPRKLCFAFIKKRISWVYVIGWEEGRQQGRQRQPVMQLDEFGNLIQIHKSLSVAARRTNVTKGNISKAMTGKHHSSGGFLWQKVNNPKKIHKILESWQDKL